MSAIRPKLAGGVRDPLRTTSMGGAPPARLWTFLQLAGLLAPFACGLEKIKQGFLVGHSLSHAFAVGGSLVGTTGRHAIGTGGRHDSVRPPSRGTPASHC